MGGYTFNYTGNPNSNNDPTAIGFRYSVNTGGNTDGNYWHSYPITINNIQNGTYIVNASVMTNNTSVSNAKTYIYIVQNRTSTETYYGGIINCPDYSSYNQGITFDPSTAPNYTGTIIGGDLNGQALYTILAGNTTGVNSTQGTSISTSAIFTYSNTPYGGGNSDNITVISICWYSTSTSASPAYISLIRIA